MRIKNKKRFMTNVIASLILAVSVFWMVSLSFKWVNGIAKKPIASENQEETTTTLEVPVPEDNSITKIVNKYNSLSKEFVPGDLVPIALESVNEVLMRKEPAEALIKLVEAAKNEGLSLICSSGYRSYETQAKLFDTHVKSLGIKEAEVISARPGMSEHQLGLAMDFTSAAVDFDLVSEFGQTPEGAYLRDNAYKYGFILRYPEGKTDITGYVYEPWHIRYIGLDVAAEIQNSGKTLEEYYGVN